MNMNKLPDETLKQGRNICHGSWSHTATNILFLQIILWQNKTICCDSFESLTVFKLSIESLKQGRNASW